MSPLLNLTDTEYDTPCPFPGCEVNCRSKAECRRHLQKTHRLSFGAAMDLLDGKGIDEWEVCPDVR